MMKKHDTHAMLSAARCQFGSPRASKLNTDNPAKKKKPRNAEGKRIDGRMRMKSSMSVIGPINTLLVIAIRRTPKGKDDIIAMT